MEQVETKISPIERAYYGSVLGDLSKHENSKKIRIKRKARAFKHEEADSPAMKDFFNSAKKSLGSYYPNVFTKIPGSGLSPDEEKTVLPVVIGVFPNNPELFFKERERFYTEINTLIEPGNGTELEIGLSVDNNKSLSAENFPLNPQDYIKYKHALHHPHVASSAEDAKGNSLYEYYIEDTKEVRKTSIKDRESMDNAMVEYVKIKGNANKVEMLSIVLKGYLPKKPGKPLPNPFKMDYEERVDALREVCNNYPVEFIKTVNNKYLEKRYLIADLVEHKILERVGSTYLTLEGENLGDTEKEVILFLDKEINSRLFNSLKAELNAKKKGDS